MIRSRATAPTRTNLLRARRRLERVEKGVDLLSRKRQALVTELFDLAGLAVEAREEIERRAATAYPALLRALALHGHAGATAIGWPFRAIEVEVRPVSVWGVAAPEILSRSPVRRDARSRGAPAEAVGPAATGAADEFEALIVLLLDGATHEMRLRRLGDALSRTSRQLNTLERRLTPRLEREIKETRRVLEEREREEHTRLRLLLGGRGARRRGAGGQRGTGSRTPRSGAPPSTPAPSPTP